MVICPSRLEGVWNSGDGGLGLPWSLESPAASVVSEGLLPIALHAAELMGGLQTVMSSEDQPSWSGLFFIFSPCFGEVVLKNLMEACIFKNCFKYTI